jgi:hypothetical protein
MGIQCVVAVVEFQRAREADAVDYFRIADTQD